MRRPRPNPNLLDRRRFLSGTAEGLAGVALCSLLADSSSPLAESRALGAETAGKAKAEGPVIDPMRPYAARPSHFPARAKNVIVVQCSGAFSHVDSFDYKPELIRFHGKPLPGNEKLVSFQGENGNLVRSPWEFRPRGRCGKMVTDLVPAMGELVDELCFIHSLTTTSNTHGPAENIMTTGFAFDGFPSMGAWVNYALGSDSEELPSFVAIEDPRGMPQSGPNNWASGFLPAAFQGVPVSSTKPIRFLARPESYTGGADAAARDALGFLNQRQLERFPGDQQLLARIVSYKLAARMQLSVPEAAAVDREPAHVLKLYGADSSRKEKAAFARNCILARRLVERGVRFVQLFNGAYASGGKLNWDAHSELEPQYAVHGDILDQPVAGLLLDLKQRGLLESTLVVFCTEFGRMPMFQAGTYGRDHNPFGFTAWLAGAGVKAPFSYGATDEFGFKAVEDVLTVHDLHATILHILGLDHERLTFYHNGIERRLTDVHGVVIDDILV